MKEATLRRDLVRSGERLRIALTYDTVLFTATRAHRLAEALCAVLAAMAKQSTVAEILDRARSMAMA